MEMRYALLLVSLAGGLAAQVPDNLKPPSTEVAFLKALGKGEQVYTCKPKAGADSQFEWVLDRPEAALLNGSGATIGKHYKGPTWEAGDGSKVTGAVQQRATAPKPGAVPWLLLKAASHEGSGTFAGVTYIQRIDTVGGVALAAGCDQSHAGAEAKADYQATYVFFKSAQ